MSHKPPKNSLTISLAESVVFQRNIEGGRKGPFQPNDTSPTSLVRGLLILDLCKPTKISSIELELTGMARTSWPQAVGSRRVYITEEDEIYHASTVFFRAVSTDNGTKDGYKEFNKGVYTYPISLMIPGNAPPTLKCLHGNVTWRLKGHVHRPGTFSHKLSASREVILVASPGECYTEDVENTIVQRQRDSQLQYMISISGRSFHIGGTLPIRIAILPTTQIKVHNISVILEERTDYYTGTDPTRIARTDAIQRFPLLSSEVVSKEGDSSFPDNLEASKRSLFYHIATAENDLSKALPSQVGPSPWTFQRSLVLPTSCTRIHVSNKNRRANIMISHTLDVIFRIEREDDGSVDRRKLFDVTVQVPVNILSCRCTPESTSLPRYHELLHEHSTTKPPSCPCEIKNCPSAETGDFCGRGLFNGLDRMFIDPASTVNSNPFHHLTLQRGDSLYDLNTQFERLVSGQESELGEAPPTYKVLGRLSTVR